MNPKRAGTRPRDPSGRIREAVLECAQGLYRAGMIDKRRMAEYEALCGLEVPAYSARKIRALRLCHKLSQAVLASVLNTSLSTVRQWEIGAKHPSGPSLKLLHLLDRKGIEALVRRCRRICGAPQKALLIPPHLSFRCPPRGGAGACRRAPQPP